MAAHDIPEGYPDSPAEETTADQPAISTILKVRIRAKVVEAYCG